MLHRHHLIPKHMRGDDSEENLTPPISVKLHAEFHRLLWLDFGYKADFIAWKVLSGQMTCSEAHSAIIRAAWADPIKGARLRAVDRRQKRPGVKRAMKRAWADPERRPQLLDSLVKARESRTPGSCSAAMKTTWADPIKNVKLRAGSEKGRGIKKPGTSKALTERNKKPCEFLGIQYQSKQELQLHQGFSDRKFYRLLTEERIKYLNTHVSLSN